MRWTSSPEIIAKFQNSQFSFDFKEEPAIIICRGAKPLIFCKAIIPKRIIQWVLYQNAEFRKPAGGSDARTIP